MIQSTAVRRATERHSTDRVRTAAGELAYISTAKKHIVIIGSVTITTESHTNMCASQLIKKRHRI